MDAERADVLIFNTAEGYFGYVEFAAGDRLEHTSGNYNPWYGQMMFYESANVNDTLTVMYHEGFHRYIYKAMPEIPIWLNEGMAEYVAATRLEKGQVVASGLVRGDRLTNLKVAMRHGWKPIAFKAIMNETQPQFYALFPALQYAQAWSMVQFFRHGDGGKWRGVLDAYVQRLLAGDDAAKAFDATFGKENVEQLQQRWLKYVTELQA
jgi:hypothetical protein